MQAHQMHLPFKPSIMLRDYRVVDPSGCSVFRSLEEAEVEYERLDQRGVKCALWLNEWESDPNLDFRSTVRIRSNQGEF